ncbi:MAG: hypothetical protein L0K86_07760, partial [Actinomycetia bacterium]|nr:hypothetical protein [Actinomycetes bacterium]
DSTIESAETVPEVVPDVSADTAPETPDAVPDDGVEVEPDVATAVAILERMVSRPLTPTVRGGLDGVRVGVLARVGRLDATVQSAYEDSLRALERAGATLVECATDLHRTTASVSLLTMLRSSALLHADAVRAAPTAFGGEARALLTLGEPLAAYGELIASVRRTVAAQTAELFARERLDAFATPATPCVAPPRGAESVEIGGRSAPVAAGLGRDTGWARCTAMPAISGPARDAALPAGVQVMAPPQHDAVCVRLALVLEGALGGA